ncbi:MAG: NUDIX hydrolase [Candidatus Aenigmarchaeota archaeon]|nr:NUDIX hydrolase [Candidatus Aenigmarchaeota archaeon]
MKIYKAGGIIPFCQIGSERYLLLQRRTKMKNGKIEYGKYEDLGGRKSKIEKQNNHPIINTAIREASEETNFVYSGDIIKGYIGITAECKQKSDEFFINRIDPNFISNKTIPYAVFLVKVEEDQKFPNEVYGNYEHTDRFHRVLSWVKLTEFEKIVQNNNLHPRIIKCAQQIRKKILTNLKKSCPNV